MASVPFVTSHNDPVSASRRRVSAIVFTALFGFVAGVIGGLVGTTIVLPAPSVFTEFLPRRAIVSSRTTSGVPALAPITASVVDLFRIDAGKPFPSLLPLDQRTGRGVAVTNDGWIVTLRASIPTERRTESPVVVGRDRRIRRVDRIAFDPITDLAFLHVPDIDVTVLPIAREREFGVGASCIIPTPDGGAYPCALSAITTTAMPGGVQSSDKWRTSFVLAPTADLPIGSPVIDAAGTLVGLLAADGRSTIPADAIASALPSLFSRGAVERNVLGVTYRDTSAFGRGPSEPAEGIVLARAGGAATIAPKSPLAGVLAEGDVILAVGDDTLTARCSFAELLQEYPIGATVVLHVLRRGAPSSIRVALTVRRGAVLLVAQPPESQRAL